MAEGMEKIQKVMNIITLFPDGQNARGYTAEAGVARLWGVKFPVRIKIRLSF